MLDNGCEATVLLSVHKQIDKFVDHSHVHISTIVPADYNLKKTKELKVKLFNS